MSDNAERVALMPSDITRLKGQLHALRLQGEDYIWRPAKAALEYISQLETALSTLPNVDELYDAAFKARWIVNEAAHGTQLTQIGQANAKDVLTLLGAALNQRKASK